MNFLSPFKKEQVRREEQQRKDEEQKLRRRRNEQRKANRELERARLRAELDEKNAEIARRQQRDEEEASKAKQVKQEQENKELANAREAERIKNLCELRNRRLKLTEPENLRVLRDNVRRRYQLDIDIWAERGVRRPDRPLVEKKMEEADGLLEDIVKTVKTWEESDTIFNAEEWKLAKQIKERLLMDGKRLWANNPPWTEN